MDKMVQDNNGKTNGHFHGGDDQNVIRFPAHRDDTKPPRSSAPMINLPPLTKFMVISILAVHAIVWLTGLFSQNLQDLIYAIAAFTPGSWSGAYEFYWWTPLTLLTFSFLHGGWLHLGINTVMLMAFGAGVEKWLGAKKMLILFAGSTLIALLFQFIAAPSSPVGVVGISGAISGFFGALLLMMQQQRALGNANNSIMPFVILWIVISAVFGFMGAPDGSPIAWLAHIGGFFGGLLITWLMIGHPKVFSRS